MFMGQATLLVAILEGIFMVFIDVPDTQSQGSCRSMTLTRSLKAILTNLADVQMGPTTAIQGMTAVRLIKTLLDVLCKSALCKFAAVQVGAVGGASRDSLRKPSTNYSTR
jgi:hypothetical protein